MSDDEDYMSDKFLGGSVQNGIRPGLLQSHSDKHSFLVLKRKREHDEINKRKNPSIRQMESEKRKEGLEKPIEETNKGFALMQKMGYKPGSCIGKNSTGRVEPIPIQLKCSREGLGRIEMKNKLLEQRRRTTLTNTMSTNEYRSRMHENHVRKQNEIDFRKSQKICEYLENEHGTEEPIEDWYWLTTDRTIDDLESKKKRSDAIRSKPYYQHDFRGNGDESDYEKRDENFLENEQMNCFESDEDDKEPKSTNIDTSEKLAILTDHLRINHFYCIWCCVKYNDFNDLNKNCPGKTRDDH